MASPAAPKAKPGKTAAAPKRALQKKLAVGAANDRFEQEADRIASRVGSGTPAPHSPPPMISAVSAQRQAVIPTKGPEQKNDEPPKPPEKRAQRKAGPAAAPRPQATAKPAAKKSAPRAQRKAASPAKPAAPCPAARKPVAQRDPTPSGEGVVDLHGGEAPPMVEGAIQRMKGRPATGLDPGTRARVENAVGHDLSDVRVHKDSTAAGAADALGAKAFTVGRDVFFGAGQYNPATTGGQKLIAHEAAHTVQQRGGSAGAQRIQRAPASPAKPTTPAAKTKKLEGPDWSIDLTPTKEAPQGGTVHVPTLELPMLLGSLKGSANAIGPASASGALPIENQPFTRFPQVPRVDREDGAAFEKWVKAMRSTCSVKVMALLDTQLKAQTDCAPISNAAGKDVYVLKRKTVKSDTIDTLLVGTVEELSQADGVLRPMVRRATGAAFDYDADHILEDQLGGLDDATNMWLLDRSYNRSVGTKIKTRIDASIKSVLEKAAAEEKKQKDEKNVEIEGTLPPDIQHVKQKWTLIFNKVVDGKFDNATKDYWTRDDILKGAQLPLFAALTEPELVRQGFKYDPTQKPKRINVFPARDGGTAVQFVVSDDGQSLKNPFHFFRGISITGPVDYKPDALKSNGTALITIPVKYEKRKQKGDKNSPLISACGNVTVKHDTQLGFGGYVTRESITGMFKESDFGPLSPMSFPDVGISPEGELSASGQISATKALFPNLQVPIFLRGDDIGLSFPIPSDKLSLGPVSVTDAAIEMGVGGSGFFLQGSAAILVKDVGQGTISARVEKDDVLLSGDFALDMDFLDPAKISCVYSLAKDDFTATATLGVKKDALPGVDTGNVTVTITRSSVTVLGTLGLGGIMAGSTITIGYAPDTGLLIEGKDLPLAVAKLPGVNDAKLTVRAVRNPDTLAWAISGGGKASLSAGGATGALDILFDGTAVTFAGRVDVAKGPAKGWLQIIGTNRATDGEGKPIENGPVGDLHIWGKGEATVSFGKVLTGTAGIEYTPDGHVIVSGEIAMPPTYDLFPKKDLSPKDPLFHVAPPDFPIWGVKVGPVGFGIFAFVDASIRAEAFVGPGQLRDAKVHATLDLDKPEDAIVDGHAQFFVPSYAGLVLDVGGGVKAQVAVAFVKGRVGLYGKLGLGVDGSFDVDVHWNQADGFSVGAEAKVVARPKFELGVEASITAGVDVGLFDIDKTWGPWQKSLGSFGPDMQLSAAFPMAWSEKSGLDIDPGRVKIDRPQIDAKQIMKGAFDMLV